MRLVQLNSPAGRRVAIVEEPRLRLLERCSTIYDLASACLSEGATLQSAIEQRGGSEFLEYDAIYKGASGWKLKPSADFPDQPSRCMVSGTGLTHQASAKNRDAMHAGTQTVTDSTRMYLSGVEGGKPAAGEAGISPEWFYKGTGNVLRAHGEALIVPEHADDGGEEPEVAGVYLIDPQGRPRRIGFSIGNEFSDHVFERKNYLYLAASKLRTCAIGPELVIDADFNLIPGDVSVERGGSVLWSHPIKTGEANMCHSLANIEHHHFKFDFHRNPGDLHIHFFGADAFSFGNGIQLQDRDVMQVRFEGMGRALRNPLQRETPTTKSSRCNNAVGRAFSLSRIYMNVESLFLKFSADKLIQFTERIEVCLGKLTGNQIWARGGENENSVGNLVLHLSGNVRQWIVSSLGNNPAPRDRDGEFGARGGHTGAELSALLRGTITEAVEVIRSLDTDALTREYEIQDFRVSGVEAVYHVVEHFGEHTGQIIFITKMLTGSDLGFYRHLSSK